MLPNDVSTYITYHVPAKRVANTNVAFRELKRCGVLCRFHHEAYDGHYKRENVPKARFDDKFTAEGAGQGAGRSGKNKGANWEEWRAGHLALSEDCDAMISEFLA